MKLTEEDMSPADIATIEAHVQYLIAEGYLDPHRQSEAKTKMVNARLEHINNSNTTEMKHG